jgi:hypothetical protein
MTFTMRGRAGRREAGRPADAEDGRAELEPEGHDLPGEEELRVVSIRDDDVDQAPVLVVEAPPHQALASDSRLAEILQ